MCAMERLEGDWIEELYAAILSLRSKEECQRFLKDLTTVSELASMAQRWEVARMLEEGSTYQEIVSKTGASSATVSRVSRSLQHGANGYRIALDRLKEQKTE